MLSGRDWLLTDFAVGQCFMSLRWAAVESCSLVVKTTRFRAVCSPLFAKCVVQMLEMWTFLHNRAKGVRSVASCTTVLCNLGKFLFPSVVYENAPKETDSTDCTVQFMTFTNAAFLRRCSPLSFPEMQLSYIKLNWQLWNLHIVNGCQLDFKYYGEKCQA